MNRKPTADEQAGMDWWNSLSDEDRRFWYRLALAECIADAWAYYKRVTQ